MAGTTSSEKNFGSTLWKVHFALVGVQVGYGGSYVLSKVALGTGANPIVLAIYRDIVALIVLIPFAYFAERGQRPRLDFSTLVLLVPLGAVGIFCSQLLMLIGLSLASAGSASVIAITVPIFVFIISAIFGLEEIPWKRRDGKAKVGGLMSAVCGAVILPLYEGPAIVGVHSKKQLGGVLETILQYLNIEAWQLGLILLFCTGLCYATYISLQVPIFQRYPAPISVCAFAYVIGSIFLAVTGVLVVRDESEWRIHHRSVVVSFVYTGAVACAGNFSIQTWAVHKCGPVLQSSYIPLQTFVAASMGYFFLGESVHLGSLLGTMLIILGLFLITWGQIASRREDSLSVKTLPTPCGQPVIKGASHLEEPLLG